MSSVSFKILFKYKTDFLGGENLVQIDSGSGILTGCYVVLQAVNFSIFGYTFLSFGIKFLMELKIF